MSLADALVAIGTLALSDFLAWLFFRPRAGPPGRDPGRRPGDRRHRARRVLAEPPARGRESRCGSSSTCRREGAARPA
jgi:hypothetical protein